MTQAYLMSDIRLEAPTSPITPEEPLTQLDRVVFRVSFYDVSRLSDVSWPSPLYEYVHQPMETVDDVCGVLRAIGRGDLASRIEYFASEEDLDDGGFRLTAESAIGFLSTLNILASDAKVQLTCSPEGQLCASWRFADKRGASLWFLDRKHVRYVAIDANGEFVDIDGDEIGDRQTVLAKLVEAGIFEWCPQTTLLTSYSLLTTLHDTARAEASTRTGYPAPMPSCFARENHTSPQTGSSIFTEPTTAFSFAA